MFSNWWIGLKKMCILYFLSNKCPFWNLWSDFAVTVKEQQWAGKTSSLHKSNDPHVQRIAALVYDFIIYHFWRHYVGKQTMKSVEYYKVETRRNYFVWTEWFVERMSEDPIQLWTSSCVSYTVVMYGFTH